MRIWVDIEDRQGVRYGAGPILTATGWEHDRSLDRAGSFAFEMPASDPRADMVRLKRVARCWAADGSRVWEHGAGIIEHCELGLSASGEVVLKVAGDDLLRELANRRAGPLALYDSNRTHPAVVTKWNSSAYWELPKAYDGVVGDNSTSESVELVAANLYLGVWDTLPFRAIHFILGAKNAQADTLKVEYWNATTGAWTALTVTDETASGGAPFAIDGDVAWTIPADWGPRSADGFVLYEVRISGAAETLDAVEFADVSVLRDEPCDDALGRTMAVMAGAWALDTVMGYDSISRATALTGSLIIRNAFVTFDGAADDGATDTYYGWTNGLIDDVNGDSVEATATIYEPYHTLPDGHALKITHTTGTSKTGPFTYTENWIPDMMKETTDYVLRFWARGDGTAQGRFRLQALGPTMTWQYLSPVMSTGVVSATTWEQIEYKFTVPIGVKNIRLFLYGPDPDVAAGVCYFDGVMIWERQGGEVYLEVVSESVLETLIRITEETGEHFILSPAGRQVAWLRSDVRNLNVQAVAAGGIAVEGNDDALLINELTEEQDGYELATRVYPYGSGTGASRVTLAHATRALPAGWSLHAADNYICYDAAETALGRIEQDAGMAGREPGGERAGGGEFCGERAGRSGVQLAGAAHGDGHGPDYGGCAPGVLAGGGEVPAVDFAGIQVASEFHPKGEFVHCGGHRRRSVGAFGEDPDR